MRSTSASARGAALRRGARNTVVVLVLLAAGACVVQPPLTFIEVDPTNSTLWLSAGEAKAYRCTVGLLECRGEGGRLGVRQCRCAE
ncbi:MAG TPA: hypothetical protein VF339_19025 [Gammaproteobacteria bacterium]